MEVEQKQQEQQEQPEQQESQGSPAAADLAAADQQQPPSASSKKRQAKAQKKLVLEFVDGLAAAQQPARTEAAKARRKALRELAAAVANTATPLEERMRLLQGSFVALVAEQSRADKQVAQLQQQLHLSTKDADEARAELAQSQAHGKLLGKTVQALQAQNRLYEAEKEAQTKRVQQLQDWHESTKVLLSDMSAVHEGAQQALQRSAELAAENAQLKEQLEALRGAQADRLEELKAQVQEQADMAEHVRALVQHTKLLEAKVQLMDALQARNTVLEQLATDYKAQVEASVARLREMEEPLRQANSVIATVDKLKRSVAKHTTVAKERAQLQNTVALLQQQAAEQAEKLRRSEAQRERLEGLCRALQGRALGGQGGQAAAADAEDEDEAAAVVARVVAAAVAAVVAAHAGVEAGSG